MADQIDNLVLEHLRAMRAELASVKDDTMTIRRELLTMKQHMAAFMAQEVMQDAEIASIKTRLDRIERRLDLVDP